jgi:hypothetical protein
MAQETKSAGVVTVLGIHLHPDQVERVKRRAYEADRSVSAELRRALYDAGDLERPVKTSSAER